MKEPPLTPSEKAYQKLDALAVAAKTDKSSVFHNYTKVYSHYLHQYTNQRFKFLEIGIFHGQSVKLWEDYFPKAELHFIDKAPEHITYHSSRSHYHFLDQANPFELQRFIRETGGEFDVIIDDGGHKMEEQMTSFVHLFTALKKGGFYFIEDLHTSYWKEFGGGGDVHHPKSSAGSTIEFLKKLIDDINYTAAVTTCADFDKVPLDIQAKLTSFQRDIFTLHFYKSLCVILKSD